jgi:hypothetical protein
LPPLVIGVKGHVDVGPTVPGGKRQQIDAHAFGRDGDESIDVHFGVVHPALDVEGAVVNQREGVDDEGTRLERIDSAGRERLTQVLPEAIQVIREIRSIRG